jgi:hypothetical protein
VRQEQEEAEEVALAISRVQKDLERTEEAECCRRIIRSLVEAAAEECGVVLGVGAAPEAEGCDDDFGHEKVEQPKEQRRAAISHKKRMKQGRSESEDARLALCRVQKKISRGERLDCANRIRAAVATEAALAQKTGAVAGAPRSQGKAKYHCRTAKQSAIAKVHQSETGAGGG